MDDANDPPAAQEVDGMDVSPALHPDPADDKENDAEIDGPHLAPPPADLRDTRFTFILRRYDTISDVKVHSPWHHFGGFRWRLLIFPKGNHTSDHDLSVYLECGGPDHPANGRDAVHITATPWRRPAKFSLHVVHPTSPVARAAMRDDPIPSQSGLADLDAADSNLLPAQPIPSDIMKETMHTFRGNASDWGFLEFASFGNLQPGQYADDEMNVVIVVKIHLEDNLPDLLLTNTNTWDSRKQTGFVGFKNQGATCYMNSLLQTLYTLSAFRQAVYNMPLPEPGNDTSGSKLSYALQKVFYELQFSETVVKTKRLTESFGWESTEAFTQHDVQELKLILCDELAERMKKVSPNKPNILTTLFQGKLLNYIECVNVDYKSTREEDFSDLSLDVKTCRNIYDSFDKYVEVEMLSGDNKYKADGFDELQEARKGVKFLKLPPVLHIHLKRFDFDCHRLTMVKINDRYEFEAEIDLCRYVENSDGSDVYVLHSVLVHIGDVNGGHYHAYIRPEIDVSGKDPKKPSHWFKFDDENVSRASEEAAIQDNFGFGGEHNSQKRGPGLDDDLNGVHDQTPPPAVFQTRPRNYQARRFSNAYMLQYLRKSEVPYLLKKASIADVPGELVAKIKKERKEEEQRGRDNKDQHLYMKIAVVTNDNMARHDGADLVDWENVRTIKVMRAMSLLELKILLQRDGIVSDSNNMRLWKCSGRQNDTIRPDSLVANGLDSQPIMDANGRPPLNQSGYGIPLHYTGRHGYHGIHDDVVRMYAEEMASIFCLDAGEVYREREEEEADVNGETLESHAMLDGKVRGEMDMDGNLQTAAVEPPYPLKPGCEVLLFLKFYTAAPVPKLRWLGHFVVDREMKVGELHPMMIAALANYARIDPSLQVIDESAPIVVYEEVSYCNIPKLDPNRSLLSQRIPLDSGCGDILIFQQEPEMPLTRYGEDKLASDGWDFCQEPSRGDGTDRPLGGRPLPDVRSYFDYLLFRIKIEFKDKHTYGGPDEAKSIFFELLRRDSYKTARTVLGNGLGVDPDYLRFFGHDINRDAPTQSPIRIQDNDLLERVLPMHNLIATGQPDYRILWYEKTEYHIREFDRKDEVKVVWRQDGGARVIPHAISSKATTSGNGGSTDATPVVMSSEDMSFKTDGSIEEEGKRESENGEEKESNHKEYKQMSVVNNGDGSSRSFSVLVPASSTYDAVKSQIRLKLEIPTSVGIRMFEVKNSKIFKFIHPEDTIPPIMTGAHDCGAELRAEPIPEDETEEALGDEYELMSVLHLAKDKQPQPWRALVFFGVPFVIKVKRTGESVRGLRQRIQEKLGVPSEEFDEWPLAEIKHQKVAYLNQPDAIYTPQSRRTVEFCSLAIEHEHKWTVPARRMTTAMSRYADKPLRIRS